jgi:K+ transporter
MTDAPTTASATRPGEPPRAARRKRGGRPALAGLTLAALGVVFGDIGTSSYFLSRISIHVTGAPGMRRWRKRLFVAVARNAASPVAYFGLPDERTITIGSRIPL